MKPMALVVLTLALCSAGASTAAAAPCAELTSLHLTTTSVTSAQLVAPGAFTPPGTGTVPRAAAQAYAKLPEFCRAMLTLRPSSDSDIKVEVWLPAAGWNGKFQAVGNGGWAGVISYTALAAAVAQGYAAASTDGGHAGNSAAFAPGHPEKVIDMGYRAVHEMTLRAKDVIAGFYGKPTTFSLWNGCSQGGRQGITEVVRYPADFDAVIAGAPAVNWVHLHAGRIAMNQAINRSASGRIPPDKYPLIHDAALNACDSADGVKDGVIENPLACHFDPQVLSCRGEDTSACLTREQVGAARAFYAPVRDSKTGALVMPGLEPGSELNWSTLGGTDPIGNAVEGFRYVVFEDPAWDWRLFDLAADVERADRLDRGVLASTDPNMKPFFDRGGKLLVYHGWSDPQVPPENTVNYFNQVVHEHGRGVVGTNIQLYMVPGMNHCSGGPGTDTFDKVAAMDEWIRTGQAPARISASHQTNGVVDRTRPLCPYPQVAQWDGKGSTSEAASVSCAAPATGR